MKVLAAPSAFAAISSDPLDTLRDHGFEVVPNPYGRRLTAGEVVEMARDCIGIISGLEPLTREVQQQLPSLRCISRSGRGLDTVDMAAAKELGIAVRRTTTAPVRAVAELTLGLILALLRGISRHDRRLHENTWKKESGWLLQGKVVGVVGLGHIGREVGKLMHCLGAVVLGTDPCGDQTWADEHGVTLVPFDRLLCESDILSLHLSRSAGEPTLIGRDELAAMKKGSFLLNLARGEAVDEPALVESLRSGKLAGAALDVFCLEPYSGPLAELDNVILTPHIGSNTRETKKRMELEAVRNLIEALRECRATGDRNL